MKPLPLIAIAVVSATVVSLVVVLVAQPTAESTGLDEDVNAQLTSAQERIDELEGQVTRLKGKLQDERRFEQMVAALQDRMNEDDGLDALKAEVARLAEQVRTNAPVVKLANKEGDEEEVALNDYIQKRIDTAVQKQNTQRRFRDIKRAKPFIKMGMTREITKLQKKMKLNPSQTKRMNESVNKAFDAVFPRLMKVMDTEVPEAEKEVARQEITASMEEVQNEAQSYLDAEQYQTFIQQQSMQGLNQWMNMFGGQNQGNQNNSSGNNSSGSN